MTPELRKQMEEMAYAHAGMQSPSAEMRPYYERAYKEGFTACSEIYEEQIEKLKEDSLYWQRKCVEIDKDRTALKEKNRKFRKALEKCSCECVYLDDRKCAKCHALADSSQGSGE